MEGPCTLPRTAVSPAQMRSYCSANPGGRTNACTCLLPDSKRQQRKAGGTLGTAAASPHHVYHGQAQTPSGAALYPISLAPGAVGPDPGLTSASDCRPAARLGGVQEGSVILVSLSTPPPLPHCGCQMEPNLAPGPRRRILHALAPGDTAAHE